MTLPKIISIKKTRLLLSFSLIFVGLFFVAKPAFALFGIGDIGLLDLAMMQMDALDFVETTVIKYFFTLVGLLVGSQIFVVISATLLQWAINLPINLDNALVQAGWNFMGGLANLFFILVFLGIAFAYIFKVETWGMKKALAPLIIVAILINFSLLFVQMFTDIAQIAWNSLLSPFGTDFVKMAIQPLLSNLGVFAGMIFAAITAYGIAALVPYGNVVASVGIMTWFLTDTVLGATGGIFLKSIFIVILNLMLGSIFLAYFFLFMARVVVFWFLAIFSPLALFAYILPNTRKYFNQWLSALLEWSFLGIIAFFLLGLGMNLFSLVGSKGLLQWGGDINTGRGIIPGLNFNYIFLIIYLLVVWKVSKKFAPKGTEMVWQAGKLALTKGGSLATARTRKLGTGLEIKRLEFQQRAGREIQTRLIAGKPLSLRQRIASKTFAGRPEQIDAKLMAMKGRQAQEEANKLSAMTKGMDDETAKSTLLAEAIKHKSVPERLRNKNKTQALVEEMARRGASVDPGLYKEAVRNAGPIPDKPEDFAKNRVQRVVLPKMPHLAENEAQMKAVIAKMNTSDIEKLDSAAKSNNEVVKQIVATMRSDLIGRLSAQNEVICEKVRKEMEKQLGPKWRGETPEGMDDRELRMLRNLHKSSAFTNTDLDLEKSFGSLQEVEDRLKNLNKPPQPPQPPKKTPSGLAMPGSPEFEETERKKRLPK